MSTEYCVKVHTAGPWCCVCKQIGYMISTQRLYKMPAKSEICQTDILLIIANK